MRHKMFKSVLDLTYCATSIAKTQLFNCALIDKLTFAISYYVLLQLVKQSCFWWRTLIWYATRSLRILDTISCAHETHISMPKVRVNWRN